MQDLEIITEENLNEEAKRYITSSLKREYASEKGTQLNALLPQMSPLNPQYLTKKLIVLQRITAKVETSTHNNKRGITERP